MDAYVVPALLIGALLLFIGSLWMNRSLKRELEANKKELSQYVRLGFQAMHDTSQSQALHSDQQLEHIRQTLDSRLHVLQQDNQLQLERMRQTVDEKLQQTLEDRISRSFAAVRHSLDEVYRGLGEMQTLATGVGDLKKVLSNVKTRGMLGEIQLSAILEQILSKEQYEENICTRSEGRERVEFAIKMPGDGHDPVYLPIDAKFHGDTYAALMEAYDTGDAEKIASARKRLVDAFRVSAREIRTKYIEPPYTTDFAVLFVPFEGLYAEAVNLGVMELVQRENRVMLAGPSTMAALLNSLHMGFKTLAIQKHSSRVWEILGAVKSEFDKFGEVLTATQRRLDQANEELDKLVGVRTRSIQRTLRHVQDAAEDLQGEE